MCFDSSDIPIHSVFFLDTTIRSIGRVFVSFEFSRVGVLRRPVFAESFLFCSNPYFILSDPQR